MAYGENQACPNDLVAVTVSSLTGKSQEMNLLSSATVQDVTFEVEKRFGIPQNFQSFIHNGRLLDFHDSIQSLVEQGKVQLTLLKGADRLYKNTKVTLDNANWNSLTGTCINLNTNGTCLLIEMFDERGQSSCHSGWHKTDIADVLYGTYSEEGRIITCSWEQHYQRKRWVGLDRESHTPEWVGRGDHEETIADSGWERMATSSSFKWSRLDLSDSGCWQEVKEASDNAWPADGSDLDKKEDVWPPLPSLFQPLVGRDLKVCLPAELYTLFGFEEGK
eukprot:TRINITY_DN21325_c0_g1_i2.p1 TRINITY_DN21325_c0_g1~~TRINITY_DN21325_c0_g1_i2.p1  ORF type:complete len:277 (-),score=22.75 TRINITY_DN21325_c0_g1_i2:180-1010(-)